MNRVVGLFVAEDGGLHVECGVSNVVSIARDNAAQTELYDLIEAFWASTDLAVDEGPEYYEAAPAAPAPATTAPAAPAPAAPAAQPAQNS